ncbi:hypothetical protein [Glycomyces artemisiae]|uniref:Uncharacterized protein n=1 Tax=Glycomyces artemisiae TaxID=1076443 RepID=A0A2T0UEW4_9ACTN|nr:hypothetical protein [Glycomyces artemisiae]PRY56485.1 hypothetical protein B0I28_109134 [Glycomyces artemisiae]
MTDLKAKPYSDTRDAVELVVGFECALNRGTDEIRQALLLDYLDALADLDEADADADRESASARAEQAKTSFASYLARTGEYRTDDDAALAAEHRQAYGMPKPGKDYSKVVPF